MARKKEASAQSHLKATDEGTHIQGPRILRSFSHGDFTCC